MFTCLGLLTLAGPLTHHLWNARSTLTTAATTLPSVLPGPWPLSPKLAGEFPSCQRLLSRQPPLSHASKSSLPFGTHPFHAHTSLRRACSLAIDGEGPRTLHPRSPQRSLCTSGFTVQRLPQSLLLKITTLQPPHPSLLPFFQQILSVCLLQARPCSRQGDWNPRMKNTGPTHALKGLTA